MKYTLTLSALVFATACFGQVACPAPIDMNSNGAVDIEDFLNVLGLFGDTDYDSDGIWDSVDDCVGAYDDCGVCNGPGFPEGYCSCTETVDALGNCGGDCEFDIDGDGVCDQYYGSCTADFIVYQGHHYATVEIDNQCWFAENLRSTHYENGDTIPSEISHSEWSGLNSGATAIYGEGEAPCDPCPLFQNACDVSWSLEEFGRLYNWHAVVDERALCPAGWHVPSKEEFEALFDFLGGANVAGDALKSANGMWGCYSADNLSDNESGFSGLPGGHRDKSAFGYWSAGAEGFWWSSSFYSDIYGGLAWVMTLGAGYSPAQVYEDSIGNGFSIRCLKDSE